MKIAIRNLGPVHYYEFDLEKDFHIIVGKNSVGKSYALTFVYLLLKELLAIDAGGLGSRFSEALEGPDCAPLLAKLRVFRDYQDISVSPQVSRILRYLFDVVLAERLQQPVAASFEPLATLSNQFASEPFHVEVRAASCSIGISLSGDRICVDDVTPTRPYWLRGIKSCRWPEDTVNGRRLFQPKSGRGGDRIHLKAQLAQEASALLKGVAREISTVITAVHFLPAIRSGLYQALSGLGPIVAELAKSRALLRREMSLPHLTVPENDYFLNMSSIDPSVATTGDTALHRIAAAIETDIIAGTVEFDPEARRIVFAPTRTSLRLDLGSTSSMVSQLAPLVAYCRWVIAGQRKVSPADISPTSTAGAMIIIEEPEAHLHPEAQVRLVEQLAALTKIGVKVVLTSHSNFVFNKISNLVITGALSADAVAATVFVSGDLGSEARPAAIDSNGIDDWNFVETAEALFMEKAEALQGDA